MIYKIIDRLFSPLYLVSCILKKDTSLWIFGEYCGNTYRCNPKHLFTFINQHHPKIKAIWLARKFHVIQKIRATGARAYHVYSPQGLFYAMRAGVAVCNVDIACDFVGAIVSKKTLYINLWHGTPLKKIGKDIDRGGVQYNPLATKIKNILSLVGLRVVHPVDLFASSSEKVSQTLYSAFTLSPEQVCVTGYPRNDSISNHDPALKKTVKNIIYMPTFRGNVGDAIDFFYPYKFNFEKMENFLSANNAKLWIRLHQFNLPAEDLMRKIEASEFIFMHQHEDIYETLRSFDILITDISSIYFDYLLLDRPILFSAFDLDKYISQDRGLYYEYESVAPGPIANDWEEVLIELDRLLNDSDTYADQRHHVCRTFNTYTDGQSCARVFFAVMSILASRKLA